MKSHSGRALSFAIFLAAAYFPLLAHEPGFSTSTVTILEDGIDAVVTFSAEEIASFRGSGSESGLESISNRALSINNSIPADVDVHEDTDNNSIFRFRFDGVPVAPIEIACPLIADLAPGHRQYLLVRDRNRDLLLQKLLKSDADAVALTEAALTSFSKAKSSDRRDRRVKSLTACLLLGLAFGVVILWVTLTVSFKIARRACMAGAILLISFGIGLVSTGNPLQIDANRMDGPIPESV